MPADNERPYELYRWALLTVTAIFAAMVGVWLAATALLPAPGIPKISGTYLDDGRSVVDFKLVDHRGEPFTPDELTEKWTVLTFGYTSAEGVTAETLGVLTSAYQRLSHSGIAEHLRVAMITVDPEADSPGRLADYMAPYPDVFRGVTGDAKEIRQLAASLGIRYAVREDSQHFDIQPEAAMMVINPDGQLRALLIPPHHPAVVAQDLHTLIQRQPGAWMHEIF